MIFLDNDKNIKEENNDLKQVKKDDLLPDAKLSFLKTKFYLVFLLKTNNGYKQISKKRIFLGNLPIRYKGKALVYNIEKPTYTRKNKQYYFINFVSYIQFYFKGFEGDSYPKLMGKLLNKGFLSGLANKQADKQNKLVIGVGIICSIASGLIGSLITMVIMGGVF